MVQGEVFVQACRRVKIIERIIQVGVERRLIRRVDARHLDRAEDVCSNGKIIVRRSVLVNQIERIDIRSRFHKSSQRHENMIDAAVSVRHGRSVVHHSAVFRRVVLRRSCERQRVAHKLPVFEVVAALVVELVFHPVDDALAAAVGEAEPCRVVIQAILQLPCGEVAVCKVGVALMQCGPRVFVQRVFAVRCHDHVELVPCAHAIMNIALHAFCKGRQVVVAGDDRVVVGDAVLHTGHEVAVITQRFECAPCGICHRHVRRNRADRDRVCTGKRDLEPALDVVGENDAAARDLAARQVVVAAALCQLHHDHLVVAAGSGDLGEGLVEIRHRAVAICSLDQKQRIISFRLHDGNGNQEALPRGHFIA